MCGIVGILSLTEQRSIDESLLRAMNDSITHRGPDAGAIHREPGLGLGHRRLSIIDLEGGQQPMFSEDGSVAVVFNGEIYNFQGIRDQLIQKGHVFSTHSDTEVIVHGWEEWSEDCVHKFRGMFAFAVWDRKQRSLFLARDRLGIKPLYYAFTRNGDFIFGSELKALLLHPSLERNLSPRAIEQYFAFGYVPDPDTILEGVQRIEPGYRLLVHQGQKSCVPERYWDISFQANDVFDENEIAEELIARLRESVKLRLITEVPLGAFLSGGVDSSAIVSMMAELLEDSVSTCSMSFGDPKFNESAYAEQVAYQYATNHHVEQVDPDDFSLIDTLVRAYDEPFADSSAIPTYRVCELARKHVTVVLSGDGGDENFVGYRRYRWHSYEERVRRAIPDALRSPLFGMLGTVYPKLDWAPKVLRAKTTFQALSRDTLEGYLHSVSIFPSELRSRMFSEAFRDKLQGYNAIEVFRKHASQAPSDDAMSRIQYLDFKTYLPGDILTKVDRASMAHGLEVRVPLLDHDFVDWVSGLSPQLKLRGREGKYIFKKAFESRLPEEILHRQKMGFGVPIANWFRGPLRQHVREVVLGERLSDSGIFDRSILQQLVDEHQSGAREHSAVLWALLMFDGFLRLTMGGAATIR